MQNTTLADAWNFAITGSWKENTATDTEYKIVETEDAFKIAFCGSSTFTNKNGKLAIDWRQNFDFWPKKLFGSEFVHRGFLEKFLSVWPEIQAAIDYGKKIEVYGFSQGAAIATIAYRVLKGLGFRVSGVVFGCPRVFWFAKFTPGYFDDLLRVENSGDLVTLVPPVLFGFWHFGPVKSYKTDFPFWDVYRRHMSYGRNVGGIDLLGGR